MNLIIIKRFNLTEQVKDLIKGYTDKCGTQYFILSMGNGITMVTSDMAGIALTFADSDLGLYITYMETLC